MAMKRAAVLIDLSGTLHIEDKVTHGAIEALEKLRKLFPIKFITNTTKESANILQARLKRCGFSIEKKEIFSSLLAAKSLVEEKQLRPMLMLEKEAIEDFEDIDCANPNAVVVGLAPSHFYFERMNEAFNLLLGDCELIAIHKGKYYKRSDGLALGPGPFVTALEFSSGKQATVVGKPSRKFFEMGISTLGVDIDLKNTIMIGDDVTDDILGALNSGLKGILVKTGKYREGDELKIPIEQRNCVENFAAAVALIESGTVL
ncbi:unnamed protein product [Auanema sp. JU1783]|nr:unnamed protein product [Auanema sp. JU1783]